MPLPFSFPNISCFLSRSPLKKTSIFHPKVSVIALSLALLTACGGSGSNDKGAAIDTLSPVITLNGVATVEHNYGDVYSDLGATATDNIDKTSAVITTGTVNTDTIGSYTITYSATDAAGNKSTLARTVKVTDSAGPVITLNGPATIEHNYGDVYTDLGASAIDNLDATAKAITTDTINIDAVNSYTITYTATDAAGNQSTLIRTVNVADTQGPVITLLGGNVVTLGQGRVYQELGAKVVDNYDTSPVIDAPIGTVNYDVIGTYELTYNATDADNNKSTLVRTVNVVAPKPFITTWKTSLRGFSGDHQIIIPVNNIHPDYEYDYNVNWGDGKTTTNHTTDAEHTYDKPGTYTVTISGNFPQIYFAGEHKDNEKLLTVEQWGDGILLSLESAFAACSNLKGNAIDSPNLRLVTDMSYMFASANAFNQDISAWDVSSVTNMSNLFKLAWNFNQDISAWNVSAVTNMSGMFDFAGHFNQDISAWDVSSVTDMSKMFSNAQRFNQNISTWQVDKVIDMSEMFYHARLFNQDLNTWNVGLVTTMEKMFYESRVFNGNISAWDVSSVTSMARMFYLAGSFNQDINDWKFKAMKDLSFMFFKARTFNQDISAWQMDLVTDTRGMFAAAAAFNQDVSAWNISAVTKMGAMFSASALSTLNFDALLKAWSVQSVQRNVTLMGSVHAYSADSQKARDILINTKGWTIGYGVPE